MAKGMCAAAVTPGHLNPVRFAWHRQPAQTSVRSGSPSTATELVPRRPHSAPLLASQLFAVPLCGISHGTNPVHSAFRRSAACASLSQAMFRASPDAENPRIFKGRTRRLGLKKLERR